MMRRSRVGLLLLLLLAGGCGRAGYEPREGDLLFEVAGSSAASEAIAGATAWHDSLKFSHVAIVTLRAGRPEVLEATGGRGVCCTAWDDFLAQAPAVGGRPGVVVKRVQADLSLADAVARARTHLGEPYDWSYRPDNGRMYCSELVCDSYLLPDGTPLFATAPMNFRTADGRLPAYWAELFARLGEPVPEGVPGSNPNDLAKDPALVEVYRFF